MRTEHCLLAVVVVLAAVVCVAANPKSGSLQVEFDVQVAQPFPPIGTVLAFAGTFSDSPNASWRVCAGQSVKQSDYLELYKMIGTAWGKGDGNDTFRLPDLRGRFLRGVNGSTGNDPDAAKRVAIAPGGNTGDAVASLQLHATALPGSPFKTGGQSNSHSHKIETDGRMEGEGNDAEYGKQLGVQKKIKVWAGPNDSDHSHEVTGGGDSESRPVNAAIYWIIRVR